MFRARRSSSGRLRSTVRRISPASRSAAAPGLRATIRGGPPKAAIETIWNAGGRRHRFKAALWGRADGLRQDGSANLLGTYSFNSVADFAANRPNSFTRTLSQPERDGSVWNSAAAFSHQWAPTRFFSLLYGARVEADGFAGAPRDESRAGAGARRRDRARADALPRESARRVLVSVQPRSRQRVGLELQSGRKVLPKHVRRRARRHRRVPRPSPSADSRGRVVGDRARGRHVGAVVRRLRGADAQLGRLRRRSEQRAEHVASTAAGCWRTRRRA